MDFKISCITYIYHNDPSLKNTFFRKYLITNKGEQIDDFIIGYFNDFDIGSHRDDYVGCDTTLNLGFGYNAEEVDVQIGVTFLQ
ncbi:MAG: hypothetical protein U5K00_17890 [Melioribacteraceae bacterium]|nr:hypothetical protein [Melioribacteraceae bacterium]